VLKQRRLNVAWPKNERAEAETAERLAAEQRMKEALAKIAELEAQLAEK